MKKLILALAASTVLATPAMAQDATYTGGVWAAGIVGLDSIRASVDGESDSESGIVFGGAVGYDADYANSFVGLEAELTESSLNVSEEDFFDTGDEASISGGRDIYAGIRMGLRFGAGKAYIKGGYTNALLTVGYDDGTTGVDQSDDMDGFRVGAGGEFAVSGNVGVRLEYRYSNYGMLEFLDQDTGAKIEKHQAVIGLVARF